MTAPDRVVGALIIALVLLTVANAVVMWMFLRRLRDRHPAVWGSLGSPTPVMNNSIRNTLRTSRFLRAKEHLRLGDARLERIVRLRRVLAAAYLVVFVLLSASILLAHGAR